MDTVDKAKRSYIMSRVRQKDTGAETLLRSSLHAAGLRYRLYDKSLPGSPDLVFPRFSSVIFVHGCYWHCHGCYRSTVPKSRRQFWVDKFHANQARDERALKSLLDSGWRVLTIWECALRGKTAQPSEIIAEAVKDWLASGREVGDIPIHQDRGATKKLRSLKATAC
jgi:DNA mismatch endonuclease, patch repair protein